MSRSGTPLMRAAAAGLAILLALTGGIVGLGALLLQPPAADLWWLSVFLLFSGGLSVSLIIAFGSASGAKALGTLRAKLLFAIVLSAALMAANVAFTAYLMFLSPHDLKLLSLLVLFSLGISAFFAVTVSRSFQSGLEGLLESVRTMGAGRLETRAPAGSGDELSDLAKAVNAMADQLEVAFARQRDLEQARRQLVAAVSHDLRTPLSTMRAMVESINDGVVEDSQTVKRYLLTLQGEIEYLGRLIDDLFELSQIDSGVLQLHKEQASVQDLISDTLEGLSAHAEQRGLRLQGEVDDALPPVLLDTRRVQRVLYNLVQNAVRHTPADGAIVIKAVDAGAEVQISVADTGEGIAPDDLPLIFESFSAGAKRARVYSRDGSGLGLSIARGIVELHGGRIWAQSVEGNGATFTFALPKAGFALSV